MSSYILGSDWDYSWYSVPLVASFSLQHPATSVGAFFKGSRHLFAPIRLNLILYVDTKML